MLVRLSLRLRIFLFFALVALGGLAALGARLWVGYARLGEPAALSAFVLAGAVGGFALLGLSAWVWLLFDEHVAKAIETVSARMRAMCRSP